MTDSTPQVVVVTSNRRLRRHVTRALASAGWDVTAQAYARETLQAKLDDPPQMFILDAEEGADHVREALQLLREREHEASTLILSNEVETELIASLLTTEAMNNFVGGHAGMSQSVDLIEEGELIVTCQKLVQRDIFGLDKYLSTWGIKVHEHQIHSTAEKEDANLAFEDFLQRIDCYRGVAGPVTMVAEELLMNGIFNAPRDKDGKAKYSHIDRAEDLQLEPSEAVTMRFGCDGRYVGISVTDNFGSLDRDVIVRYLQRCLLGDQGQIEDKAGGAGLGLFMVFNSITQLIFNIDVGKKTEVIALFYVRAGARALKESGRSLNLFLLR